MIHRHAVFQGVRAARVVGDVAADGCRRLTRRIGRKTEFVRRAHLLQMEVYRPGLDQRAAVGDIDFENLVHPRSRDHQAAAFGQSAAG